MVTVYLKRKSHQNSSNAQRFYRHDLFIVSLAHMIYDSNIKLKIIMIATKLTKRKTQNVKRKCQTPNATPSTVHSVLFIQTQNMAIPYAIIWKHCTQHTHTHIRRWTLPMLAGRIPFQIMSAYHLVSIYN